MDRVLTTHLNDKREGSSENGTNEFQGCECKNLILKNYSEIYSKIFNPGFVLELELYLKVTK